MGSLILLIGQSLPSYLFSLRSRGDVFLFCGRTEVHRTSKEVIGFFGFLYWSRTTFGRT